MKIKIVIIALLLPLMAMAEERSAAEAAKLAAECLNEQEVNAPQRRSANSASSFVLSHTRAKLNSDQPAFYVFNRPEGGFVVVSGDDRTEDVLMYSTEGYLDVDQANDNVLFWLNRLQKQITAVNEENAVDKSPARQAAQSVTPITPLLKNKSGMEIAWGQDDPYNMLCPKDNKTATKTGCVATAAAQVMYKWCHPKKGTGEHSYTWNGQTVSQDFENTTFDWNNMLYAYGSSASSTQKKAVATLMRCCGVACNMNYGVNGSGSYTDNMAYGLVTYLGYSIDKVVYTYTKDYYKRGKGYLMDVPYEWEATTDKYTAYFNADLEKGRPIVMGGSDTKGSGGHEFVVDGRDVNNKFHINFGWNGSCNSYCTLTAIKAGSYDFSDNIDAIIGLRLKDTIHVESVRVSPAELTIKINEKATLNAVFTPENASDQGVTWSSDNLKVATISTTGEILGLSSGTATITATSRDGAKTGSAVVTVSTEVLPLPEYKLLTDTSELKDSLEFILVAQNGENYYAMTSQIMTGKSVVSLGAEVVKEKDGVITKPVTSKIASWNLVESEKGWNLYEETNGQLGATAEQKLKWNGGTQTWTITIDGNGDAAVTSTTTKYGKIAFSYNAISSKFYPVATLGTLSLPKIYARTTAPSALNAVKDNRGAKIDKVLIDGQLYIVRGEHIYTVDGQLVK